MMMMNLVMLLLLAVSLSCSRVNDRYSSDHSGRHRWLLIVVASIVVVILMIIRCMTTTTTAAIATNTTMDAIGACIDRTRSALVRHPLSHWRRSSVMRLLRVLLMHRYSNRGHVARINNRDSSCGVWYWCDRGCRGWIGSGRILLIVLMLLLLYGRVVRWGSWRRRRRWNGWIWRWIWRCAPLNSFPMLSSLGI